MSISQRQRDTRVEGKLLIRFSPDDEELAQFTGNLGRSGLFIETRESLFKLGEKLSLEVGSPTSDIMVKAKGAVVRVARPNQLSETQGLAIAFSKLDTRQTTKLIQLLKDMVDAKGLGCRKYPRLVTQLEVELHRETQQRKALALDLSFGGLFIETPTTGLRLGDTIDVHLNHKHSLRGLHVPAEIVHIRQGELSGDARCIEGIGVRFITTDLELRKRLKHFLYSSL